MADAFDAVVLGGGSGGYVAAIRLAQYGRSVALVEKDKLGGTCLHRGCIPTKVFLESAGLYQRMQRAGDFGLSAKGVEFDFGAVAKRKDRIVAANEGGIKSLMRANGIEVIAGAGKVEQPGELTVDGRKIKARDVVLATGSRPMLLPGLEPDGERIVTSDHVTAWTELPRSCIVVGASAVGAELASCMLDFGVEVTLVEFLPRVLPREEPEVSELVSKDLAKRGATILVGAKVLPETVKAGKTGVTAEVEVGGERKKVRAETMLIAIGRQPNGEGLPVELERGFVKVDGQMRTSAPNVYACGDVVGGLMLAHVAYAEGKIAAAAIAGKPEPDVDYDAMPRVTYTRPEVASVGLTEEQASKNGREVKVGRFSLRANPKAMIEGESEGLVKVVSDGGTGEVLGVHIVGPHAGELIAEAAFGKLLETTPLELALTVHPHPSLSEALQEAAADVLGLAIHAHKPRR